MTELLTVMTEIDRDFELIAEPAISRVQRELPKMQSGEKPLGAIHNEALKKLWTLAAYYDVASQQAELDAKHKADTEEQAAELRQKGLRFEALEEIARDLFWVQVKDDIGPAAWDANVLGVRANWMLARGEDRKSAILQLLGGIARPPEE